MATVSMSVIDELRRELAGELQRCRAELRAEQALRQLVRQRRAIMWLTFGAVVASASIAFWAAQL